MSETSDPIFARIAARYDRINRILSLGQERKWRASGVRQLNPGTVLDLGCGTGDTNFEGRSAVGLDPVVEMLELSSVESLVAGVGEEIPLRQDSVDGVFSAYVFRNLSSVNRTLDEISRVLKPGSRAVIIDLARPVNPILRFLHRIGTAITLPMVGLIFAGAPKEYWYLHHSLDSLPPPERMFKGHGLQLESIWRMGVFGFVYGATLYKPPS